ncbi:MAG: HAD family hydrolase [Dissulfurispiraceae bacterium]
MFEIEIPGFGPVMLHHLVSDFTGTLSVDGELLPGVKEKLNEMAGILDVHILTADTFGKARNELQGVKCDIHILTGESHDIQKEEYVQKLGAGGVIALGNGNNDRRMLKAARVGIAVCLAEGCSRDAVVSADIVVLSPIDALNLILNSKRMKATLRF